MSDTTTARTEQAARERRDAARTDLYHAGASFAQVTEFNEAMDAVKAAHLARRAARTTTAQGD
jgi:hypothetical protein